MPAILNIAANLWFGAGLAFVVRGSRAHQRDLVSWPFFFLLAFQAVVVTPIATYLFRFYPQWSMLYWFDPQIFPELDQWIGLLSLLAIACNFGAAIAGFALTRRGLLQKNTPVAALPVAVGALLFLGVGTFFGERVVFVGDYDAFLQGQAPLLIKRLPGWLGAVMYGSALAFVLWVRSRFADHDPTLL